MPSQILSLQYRPSIEQVTSGQSNAKVESVLLLNRDYVVGSGASILLRANCGAGSGAP